MTVQFIPDDNFTKEVLKNCKLKLKKIINNNNFKIFFEEVSVIEGKRSGKPQIIESYIT
jgi:hypothetical protein